MLSLSSLCCFALEGAAPSADLLAQRLALLPSALTSFILDTCVRFDRLHRLPTPVLLALCRSSAPGLELNLSCTSLTASTLDTLSAGLSEAPRRVKVRSL